MGVNIQFAVFLVVQGLFWVFLIRSWTQILFTKSADVRGTRQWFALGSLVSASITLTLTAAMTIYSKTGQKQPYDRWEGKYLFFTVILSIFGVILGAAGKRKPRLVGLSTSVFTLLVAVADGISL
jgi:hypothetical protein